MASYKELAVWQKAMELVEEIYRLIKLLPKEERYALSDQMRRAAISIPSNIAEGQARESKKEFLRFLAIAQGSRAELETQLEICIRLDYFSEANASRSKELCDELGRMIYAMMKNLRNL